MIFTFIWNLFSFVIALGLLVAVHEFGHFWVARRCGVTVERFSIGFGKAIWRKVGKDGTEYVLAMIPLGGYVKMLDERVADVPADKLDGAFNRKSVFQRIAIVAAGPLANFVFAVFAFWLMYLIGVNTVKPIVGSVTPGSIAAQAGLNSGQQFIKVGSNDIQEWQDVNLAIVSALGDEKLMVEMVIPTTGHTKTAELNLTDWQFNPEQESALSTLGINPFYPEIILTISVISKDSAAQQAGLMIGDQLLTVNEQPIGPWKNFRIF